MTIEEAAERSTQEEPQRTYQNRYAGDIVQEMIQKSGVFRDTERGIIMQPGDSITFIESVRGYFGWSAPGVRNMIEEEAMKLAGDLRDTFILDPAYLGLLECKHAYLDYTQHAVIAVCIPCPGTTKKDTRLAEQAELAYTFIQLAKQLSSIGGSLQMLGERYPGLQAEHLYTFLREAVASAHNHAGALADYIKVATDEDWSKNHDA
jgi:hypothetical protein